MDEQEACSSCNRSAHPKVSIHASKTPVMDARRALTTACQSTQPRAGRDQVQQKAPNAGLIVRAPQPLQEPAGRSIWTALISDAAY